MRGSARWRRLDAWLGRPLYTMLRWRVGARRNRGRQGSRPPRVAVIAFGGLGDSLLISRSLMGLPSSTDLLLVCATQGAAAFQLCGFEPDLVVRFDKNLLRDLVCGLTRVSRHGPDVVIDMERWQYLAACLAAATSARAILAGFSRSPADTGHNAIIKCSTERERHVGVQYDNLIGTVCRAMGSIPRARPSGPWVATPPRAEVIAHLNDLGCPAAVAGYVVLHAGAGGSVSHGWPRVWPVDRYVQVARTALAQGMAVLVTGSDQEDDLVAPILVQTQGRAFRLPASADLRTLAGVLRWADRVITGNNGVMHLAAAVGAPLVALHGPTSALLWGPLSPTATVLNSTKPCAPCLFHGHEYCCEVPDCMSYISLESVLEAARLVPATGVTNQ